MNNRINMAKEIEDSVKEYLDEFWERKYSQRIEDGFGNVIGFHKRGSEARDTISSKLTNKVIEIVESKIENRVKDMLMEDILKDFRENRADITEVVDIKSSGRYRLIVEEDNDFVNKTMTREGNGKAHIIMVYEC